MSLSTRCNICNEQMQKLLPVKFSYCQGCFHIRNESSIQYKNTIYSAEFYKQFAIYTLVRYIENNTTYLHENKNKPLRVLLIYNTHNSLLDAFDRVYNEIFNKDVDIESEETDCTEVIENAKEIIYEELNSTTIDIDSINIEELDSITSTFNIVIVENSIDYLDDPTAFLNKCRDLIKDERDEWPRLPTSPECNECEQVESNNLIVIQTSYNNFILDKEFYWTKESDISKNIFNSNSMKLLSTKCGLILNNVAIIDPNYIGDELSVLSTDTAYNNYLFELSDKKIKSGNLNEVLLEELDNDIYSEKKYELYHLYYFRYCYTLLTQMMDDLIKYSETEPQEKN